MDGLHHLARVFVESQVRTAVDRQVDSWKSVNSGARSLGHASAADSRAEPNSSGELEMDSNAPERSIGGSHDVLSDWIARIQTLVTEVLNTALQNATAALTDRQAALQQQHKSTERHHHRHHHKHPQQLTRESVELVYTNILNRALARTVSHLYKAPASTTESITQDSDSTEQPQSQSLSEPEQPVGLSTTQDLPNQPDPLLPEQPHIELCDGNLDEPSSSHRHHHKHRHHRHKRRVLQVAEHFCSDLLAEAVLHVASRSNNDASPAVIEDPELLPQSPLDSEQAPPQELVNPEASCSSTDESIANALPPESSSRDDEPAPEPLQLGQLLVQEPAIAPPPRISSSDRRKHDAMAFDAESKRLCSSVAEKFVTGLISKVVARPRFMEKAPVVAPEQAESISEPAPPPSAPVRPAKGRTSPERSAKSREKDLPPPEMLTTAKSFSSADPTSFVLPPLILSPAKERTPPLPLEPLITKEHKKKSRSKDHNHRKPVAKRSNDLTLDLKTEQEAEIGSCESPAAITARAAAFLYLPRSAASLPGQHARRQDTLDPVMKISHSRDSPRAAMLANAKIMTSKSALLRPIAVPSPVVLPPSPTRERSKEKASPAKTMSPAKKRSGFCQMCVQEGRSCKINDCLKHQLLK